MTRANIKFTSGMQFVASADSGHAVVMDADTDSGGNNTGSRPMELLLMGLGGCSGMDIISILRKKKQQVTGLEAQVSGTMADDYPHKYTEITIEYIVRGKGVSDEAVKRAVQLSMDKYCSVKATLEGSARINFSYRIIEE
ncbi:MAG: OsmC family protein [Nitrospirota bacterium]|nr:OsmC family protein [Nitrospirota bacterium]